MSLRGSLDTFALPDVLALLATTAKSGELHVTGPAGDGRVWLDSGQVVGADGLGTDDLVDVVVGLLRLDEGDFVFHGDREAPDPVPPAEVAALLAQAEARLAEWREVEAILPSPDVVLSLVPTSSSSVRLSRDQWAAVVALGEGRTVDELADRLDGDELARWRLIAGLVEAGLAEVGAELAVAPVARGEVAQQLSTLNVATLTESNEDIEDEADDVDDDPIDEIVAFDEVVEAEHEEEEAETEEVDAAVAPVSAASAAPNDPADAVSRGTLLKFLSSVRS